MGLLVSIDNGGTLTDICAFDGRKVVHAKTLTTPHDLTECLMSGLAALGERTGHGDDLLALVSDIDHLRYSTTQGTNAIVQRKGPELGIVVSSGDDAARIRQAAPDLFDRIVDGRIVVLSDMANASELVQAIRLLIADGAGRLVIVLSDEDGAARETAVRRQLYSAFPRHLLGAVPLLFSTDLCREAAADMVRRGWSGLLNAFLHPSMEQFLHHAEERLRRERIRNPMLVFRNDGGSTRVSRTIALHTYSSGPRGGAEGAATLARHYGFDRFVSIDIGGTTTDLAIFENGAMAEHRFGQVEGAPIAFPLADVPSVAAGGGSILSVCNGVVTVGPESMGALPGPACFGRGGTNATLTDVLLLSGVLDGENYFSGWLRLDRDRATNAVRTHLAEPLDVTIDAALEIAISAYEDKVAEAIREQAGENVPKAMLAFGGAGPMSACGIAEKVGINTVLIPRLAAVFSAFGISFSPVKHRHASWVDTLSKSVIETAQEDLLRRAARAMEGEGFDLGDCALSWLYREDAAEEAVSLAAAGGDGNGRGQILLDVERALPSIVLSSPEVVSTSDAAPAGERGMPVFRIEQLVAGATATGPCLVDEEYFTAWIRKGWRFTVTGNDDLLLTREGA